MGIERLTERDIQDSLTRLQAAFAGDYGPYPLCEGTRKIGSLAEKGDTIYLTFRGSVNSFAEILSCLNLRKCSAEKWGLAGKVHAGIHASFCKIQESIEHHLSNSPSLRNRKIVVEGYSRGSALAMLTAAYLAKRFAADQVTVLTYSPMNVFDQTGAESYQSKIKKQWNFVCKNDFFPKWIGPSLLGFCALGKRIEFSAAESPSYVERVQKRAYTHLLRLPLIGTFLRWIIPLRLWEAHMPETYQDGSILAMRKTRARSSLSC